MPKGIGYGDTTRMKRAKKKAGKKAVAVINKRAKQPVTKRHGVAVMKDDPRKPGRKVGYATVTKTKPSKSGKVRQTTKAGRKSLRKVRGR